MVNASPNEQKGRRKAYLADDDIGVVLLQGGSSGSVVGLQALHTTNKQICS